MSLICKLEFPPGSNTTFKTVRINPANTCAQAVKEIVDNNQAFLKLSSTQYTLCLPPANEKSFVWTWFEADKPIKNYPLQNKDTLQLKRRHQIIKVRFRRAYERVLIDVTQPMASILPLLEKKFQIDNINEFTLYVNKTPLDAKKSLEQLRISPEFLFTLTNENEEEVDEEETKEDDEKDSKDEKDEKDEKLNLNSDPKSIKNPTKAGFIQTSHNKKKFETHWVILKKAYLFQYKTQSDKKPLSVMDLTKDLSIRRLPIDPSARKATVRDDFNFEIADKKKKDVWIFKCENEIHVKEWVQKITQASKPSGEGSGSSTGYFGRKLAELVPQGKLLPNLVEQCTRYIDQKGLNTVGIFRLSGSALKIEEYKKAFDSGERPDLSKEQDPHAVAGLLKLYFRNLPEPLLTFELYDQFIAAQSVPEKKLRARYVRLLIEELPKINFNVLKHLVEFLNRIQQNSATNKMYIHNLATVFGPNLLMHPSRSTLQMVEDTAQINGIVNTLIEDYDTIFNPNSENEIIAVALYDYPAKDPDELPLKVGQKVKVFSQDPSGWWTGELVDEKGRIGRYPGSYVEIPKPKTKKQQFKEEMEKTRKKLQEEKLQLIQLQQSQKQLEDDIKSVIEEKEKFAQEIQLLRTGIQKTISENKLNFTEKFFKVYELSSNYSSARTKVDEARDNLIKDFYELKKLVNGQADNKTLKTKTQEKLREPIQLAVVKLNGDKKKREIALERFGDLQAELELLSLVI